ncbi:MULTISPECIES: hypothetical protein [Pseudonocardia]|uniref:Uncharacterized protein n=2 Tax=Pseudonocardia TaxID=1847 RepID=A0A1Y2MUV1_PSEAH|nr:MULTISPECIES: hypothetical protein [Pseudonocardia]OSY38943.1 hypothetical protein BG845_03815 [Pseudonocardia autotrophica]TDN76199.1 hypothetical protein C8E95_5392 [Pseudonocardia autotrophica]BBG00180.1 hypothetical protein Pdca_13890 [Pseudonocardia autotrophica]GEC26751.1 hypothetical protein PSA01_37800 [Pseudonocardia saturnea]
MPSGGSELLPGLDLVGDVLVPLGLLLTVVTTVATVHRLKGKPRLALLAPLSVVSVIGIAGIARVAKPSSPWARWRYSPDRMAQARIRFGAARTDAVPRRNPPATGGFVTVLIGVLAGVGFGAVTSLAGGVIIGHALLASAGRAASCRVCGWVVAIAAVGQLVAVVVVLPGLDALPGVVTTLVTGAGVLLLRRPAAVQDPPGSGDPLPR